MCVVVADVPETFQKGMEQTGFHIRQLLGMSQKKPSGSSLIQSTLLHTKMNQISGPLLM